jgi:hypothetical protein
VYKTVNKLIINIHNKHNVCKYVHQNMQFHNQDTTVMNNVCSSYNMFIIKNYKMINNYIIVLNNVHKHNHLSIWKLNKIEHNV